MTSNRDKEEWAKAALSILDNRELMEKLKDEDMVVYKFLCMFEERVLELEKEGEQLAKMV